MADFDFTLNVTRDVMPVTSFPHDEVDPFWSEIDWFDHRHSGANMVATCRPIIIHLDDCDEDSELCETESCGHFDYRWQCRQCPCIITPATRPAPTQTSIPGSWETTLTVTRRDHHSPVRAGTGYNVETKVYSLTEDETMLIRRTSMVDYPASAHLAHKAVEVVIVLAEADGRLLSTDYEF